VAGLRIAGLSGIHRESSLDRPRPDVSRLGRVSNKAFTGFTNQDLDRLADQAPIDILMTHEWPAGLGPGGQPLRFGGECALRASRRGGSPIVRLLVDYLAPKLVLCGHRHVRYRAAIPTDGGETVDVWCLAKVEHGPAGIAGFRVTPEGGILPVDEGWRLGDAGRPGPGQPG